MNGENKSRVERDGDDNDVEMVDAWSKEVYVDDVQDGDGPKTEVATWTEVFWAATFEAGSGKDLEAMWKKPRAVRSGGARATGPKSEMSGNNGE